MNKQIKHSIAQLADPEGLKYVCRRQEENHPMPSTEIINKIVKLLRSVIFPGYFGNADVNPDNVRRHIEENVQLIHALLLQQIKSGMCFENSELDFHCTELNQKAENLAACFIAELPQLRDMLHKDAVASFNGDPASKSLGEVIFCYPGIRAISSYRIAHALLELGVPIIPRVITELAHTETGIDIHPGAVIADSFMIDHGTGVVIGETSRIGRNVRIYQGVTLGAKSFPLDENGNPIKGIDRHPKLGDNVIIYSNSTILGNIRVGNNAVIGGNIWVDSDVPAGAKVLQRKRVEEDVMSEGTLKKKDKKHKSAEKNEKVKEHKNDKKEKYRNEKINYTFDPKTDKPIPPFSKCKGCKSKNGCSKCRTRYEKKYGVS